MSSWRRSRTAQAVIRELDAVGIKPEISWTGSTHIRIVWMINGVRRVYTASASPSCRLAHKKARCDVRRMLKTDGISVS